MSTLLTRVDFEIILNHMRIEKVNDNQIRCTLSREDLEERQLKISEIAYGSDKAKMLFKDVMQQANYEYGFEADNIPLMIEAIPMNTGCIVFIITKVEDPEELDTRFSRFAPSVHEDSEEDEDSYEDNNQGELVDVTKAAEEVFDLFKKIAGKAREASMEKNAIAIPDKQGDKESKENKIIPAVRLYSFVDMDSLIDACKMLVKVYRGESSLYKNPGNGRYVLMLTRALSDEKEFVRICNLMMEYGSPETTNSATIAYIEEHYDMLIEDNAVQNMSLV